MTLVWSQDRVPGISMKKIRISKENNILFSTEVFQESMEKIKELLPAIRDILSKWEMTNLKMCRI